MTTKKKSKLTFDPQSPEFEVFKKRFKHRFSKKRDAFYYEQDGACIADETVKSPPHQDIVLELFPDVALAKFLEISKEVFVAGQSYMEEVPDYYDTHFSRYSFEIKFTTLYQIYLKYAV